MTSRLGVSANTSGLVTQFPPPRNGRSLARSGFRSIESQPGALPSRSRVLEERPPREHRHWSPKSQVYAPGDVLLHLISDGWQVYRKVFVESYRCVSWRHVNVYHFVLVRRNERQSLRVVDNPAVRRLVQEYRLTVKPVM